MPRAQLRTLLSKPSLSASARRIGWARLGPSSLRTVSPKRPAPDLKTSAASRHIVRGATVHPDPSLAKPSPAKSRATPERLRGRLSDPSGRPWREPSRIKAYQGVKLRETYVLELAGHLCYARHIGVHMMYVALRRSVGTAPRLPPGKADRLRPSVVSGDTCGRTEAPTWAPTKFAPHPPHASPPSCS